MDTRKKEEVMGHNVIIYSDGKWCYKNTNYPHLYPEGEGHIRQYYNLDGEKC